MALTFLVILFILGIILWFTNPHLDYVVNHTGRYRVLWYNAIGERKFIILYKV